MNYRVLRETNGPGRRLPACTLTVKYKPTLRIKWFSAR